MGRHSMKAGYFKEIVEKQKVTISQNVHVRDESGNLMFEEDKATPIMQPMAVEIDADVKNLVWVPQQEIAFTPEEEEARDAEEEMHEYEKLRPVALTDRQEMDLLLESGPEAVKASRAAHQKAMDEFLVGYTPLSEKVTEKQNAVAIAQERAKENAIS